MLKHLLAYVINTEAVAVNIRKRAFGLFIAVLGFYRGCDQLLDVIDEVGGIYLLVAKRLFTSGSLKMQFPTMQEKDSFSESNLTKNSPHLLQPIADNLVATAKALNHFMKGASKTQDTLKPFISNLKYSTTINSTRPSFKDRAIEIVE